MRTSKPASVDRRFETRLRTGAGYEDIVAQKIAEKGFVVRRPPLRAGDNPTVTQKDVVVGPYIIEVKSRNLSFTGVRDFPFSSIIVDGAWGFDKKDKKPALYVFISQRTGAVLVLDVQQSREHWDKVKQEDPHMRGSISEKYWAYHVGRQWLHEEEYLYKWLERRVQKP